MNKTSKKRAFFVVLVLCLIHISVAVKATNLFSMKRASGDRADQVRPMNIYADGFRADRTGRSDEGRQSLPEEPDRTAQTSVSAIKDQEAPPNYTPALGSSEPVETPRQLDRDREDRRQRATDPSRKSPSMIEPSLLMAAPIICAAVKEGRIDRDSLIFSKKDVYNSGSWKKPFDVLRDRDEEGIKILLSGMGKDFPLEVLRKEGIEIKPAMSPEQIMLGKGYTIEKKKLLSLFYRHVAEGYNDLFPLMLQNVGVIKTKTGFELYDASHGINPSAKEEEEWLMPDLASLPLRIAVEKLAAHTSKIKVYGAGVVIGQSPRPLERLRGESECSIHGRLYTQ